MAQVRLTIPLEPVFYSQELSRNFVGQCFPGSASPTSGGESASFIHKLKKLPRPPVDRCYQPDSPQGFYDQCGMSLELAARTCRQNWPIGSAG